MKNIFQKLNSQFALGLFAMVVVAFSAVPQVNAAVTSGQATIHNAVTVSYSSGTNNLFSTASVDVTVTTLAAAPNITSQGAVTLLAGDTYIFVYTVVSQANGPDDYVITTPTPTATNVSPATGVGITTSPLTLWAGMTLSSGAGTITIPAGSETGITAGTTIVELLVGGVAKQYTVASIAGVGGAAIAAESTTAVTGGAAAGTTTPAVNAVLTLTPVGAATAITAANVGAGIQVGEVGTFTVDFTAGTPTTAGTDGTYVIPAFAVTTTATDAGGAVIATNTAPSSTITVSSPSLTITKLSRNVTAGDVAFVATGTSARPGEVIEYQITVSNNSGATASSVSISDALPDYTAIKTGVYNGAASDIQIDTTVALPAPTTTTTFGLAANLVSAVNTLNVNIGTGAILTGATATPGSLAPNDSVVILYQVTVQ